jgi:hypothetical protein
LPLIGLFYRTFSDNCQLISSNQLDLAGAGFMVKPIEVVVPFPKRLFMKKIAVLLCLLCGLVAPAVFAQSDSDGVTVKSNTVFNMQGGQLTKITEPETLPFDVWMNTNCYFKVGDGKLRLLGDGQIIRRDGWLVSPDGSVEPVVDHVMMRAGKVIVVRDGVTKPLAEQMVFPNGLVVNPDGTCTYTDTGNSRLQDGQLFQIDGTSIPARDTATFINGHVVLQRGGTLVTINSNQIMGMNDGSRVRGDGYIVWLDKTETQMVDGQTVLFQGVPAKH